MGNLSQYRGAGMPIGSMMGHQERGTRLFLGGGQEWLRSGVLALASAYPDAAALPTTQAFITQFATTTVNGVNSIHVASDGAGRYVAAMNSGFGKVRVSLDDGDTWLDVTLPTVSVNVTDVIYAQGKFVAVGNDGSAGWTWVCSGNPSVPGNWTAIQALSTSSASAGTARIKWSGTAFVFVLSNPNPSTQIATSPTANAGTWTARTTVPGAVASNYAITCFNDQILVTIGTGTAASASSNLGATWVGITLPFNPVSQLPGDGFVFGGAAYLPTSQTTVQRTTSFAGNVWTAVNLPVTTNTASFAVHGGRVWAVGASGRPYLWSSPDMADFLVRSTFHDFAGVLGGSFGVSLAFSANSFVAVANGNSTFRPLRHPASVAAPNGVGVLPEVITGGTTNQQFVGYVRIK